MKQFKNFHEQGKKENEDKKLQTIFRIHNLINVTRYQDEVLQKSLEFFFIKISF